MTFLLRRNWWYNPVLEEKRKERNMLLLYLAIGNIAVGFLLLGIWIAN